MRIDVYTEHFPNTYKPYFDTQFARLLEDGHTLRIFAFGKFDAALSARARAYHLPERTRYVPETLRDLKGFAPQLARALASPRAVSRAKVVGHGGRTRRQRAGDLARALRLPDDAPDLILIHNLVTAKSYPFLRALYPSARVALYFHGGEVPAAGTIDEAESRRAFAMADRVFTNTGFSRAQAIDRGCAPEKLVVSPVGFWLDDYRPPEPRPYRPEGALRLISVGRLSPEKGLADAIDALAILRERGLPARYRIVGAGPQQAELAARIAALKLADGVELVGERAHEDVLALLAEADALLLPSVPTARWAETQACVVQEAMLMGCAVVASRMGGVPESLAPELHRFLVPPAEPLSLAAAVEQLAQLEVSGLAELGRAGARFARERYDIRALNAQLLAEATGERGLSRSA